MTPTQQTDLKTWLKNQDEELPSSLDDLFIEDCVNELYHNSTANTVFNSKLINYSTFYYGYGNVHFNDDINEATESFENLYPEMQTIIIQTLLSRTPEGAVIPFLDVENKEYKKLKNHVTTLYFATDRLAHRLSEERLNNMPKTLDELLYREFTEALRVGKTFEEALKIINKTYILNRYV